MRCFLLRAAPGLLGLALFAGDALAETFKYEVHGDGRHEFKIPASDSATIVITGDGEDSEIVIDAEAVKGRVRVIFKCDLEDAKITITMPEVAKPMSVVFTKECDLSDASLEIVAPMAEKDQPVNVTNDAHDKEDFRQNIIRG